ncbi:amidophosphoribosyltransferase [Candidatus Sumerlaeota bacterium]|nr:amidophosphoribosyltransferase [Candidatus Sumerlaeota bacterium]
MIDSFMPMGASETCGIVAVAGHPEAAKMVYLGLYALQHRGQESAGIVSSDGKQIYSHVGDGRVSSVFTQKELESLPGNLAIGHVRYSTTGASAHKNSQPILVKYKGGLMAIAHNGNITNASILKDELESRGAIFQTTTDSELLLHLIAQSSCKNFEETLYSSLIRLKGSYSILLLHGDRLIVMRDPRGFKPLCIGSLDDAHVFASESCALDIMGARLERDVKPGEIIRLENNAIKSERPFAPVEQSFCVFEYIYFCRPDSIVEGKSVHEIRHRLGAQLAEEHPIEADVVIPVPDSSNSAALGFSRQSGIPFDLGLIRSHYVGRTFIQPTQKIRDFGARVKYNTIKSILNNKRVVVVDDSIVRGTTSKQIVTMLRNGGAKEIHFLSSAPPWKFPCYFGIDTPSEQELIANTQTIDKIREYIGSDTLGYTSLQGMLKVMHQDMTYCCACFDGKYPGGKPDIFRKDILEI